MLSPRLVVSACLILGPGLACNSDDLFLGEGSSSTGEPATTTTTGTPTTGPVGSTSTTDATTIFETTETPPQQTCRDVLMCVGGCALMLDPACFQLCAEGLQPEEAMKAGQLGLCIGQLCFESGACSPDALMDPACLACIGFGILSPNPPGCEAEAEACS